MSDEAGTRSTARGRWIRAAVSIGTAVAVTFVATVPLLNEQPAAGDLPPLRPSTVEIVMFLVVTPLLIALVIYLLLSLIAVARRR